MKKTNLFNNGIPVSLSLNPDLETEHVKSKSGESKNRLLIISCIVFVEAIAMSFIAKLLVHLIDLITNSLFFGKVSYQHSVPAENTLGIFVIAIPTIGGVIVGLMAYYGSKAIRGHGIPEAMEQILSNQSKIKPSLTYLKPLSAAISIGSGGPFGAEGPIIATGGALGSTIGQLLKVSHHERKILLTAGASAGMATIFGTPVAAIFLAIELLLFEFSPRSLIPVAIACVVGTAGHRFFFGQHPVFEMQEVMFPNDLQLFIYSVMGVFMGILSVLVNKVVYFIEDTFEKLPIHWMWWPAIGGVLVGVTGYFAPRTLGVGYENIVDILSDSLTLQVILSLCVLKFISWAIALGSGTSGGTLAPLLTIGGAAGVLIGKAILYFFPLSGITLPLAALVGMAAMFAGASRALLTSIVFAFESTAQTNALLPLLGACVTAYLISFFLMKHTIMTEKIARRGIKTPNSYKPDILEKLTVEDVASESGIVLSEDTTIQEAVEWLRKEQNYKSNYFIVSNGNGEYKGIISSSDLFNTDNIVQEKIKTLLKNTHTISIRMNDALRTAAETMADKNVDVLPIISSENNSIVGILSYHDILTAYKYEADEHEMKKPEISLKRNGLKILIQGQRIIDLTKRKHK
ncbi:MAG: chloride channel protein [Bacteroidia bacterium]|nr:chloride channel protein [Bacteroidia bacterium]